MIKVSGFLGHPTGDPMAASQDVGDALVVPAAHTRPLTRELRRPSDGEP
jgi:hypothetical protein